MNLTEVIVDLNKATTDNSLYLGDIDTTLNSLDIVVEINDTVSTTEQSTRINVSYINTLFIFHIPISWHILENFLGNSD